MIEHLSYSSITTYLKCSYQWKLKYVDKLPQKKSEALVFGSAIHKAIALILQQKDETGNHWQTALEQTQAEQQFELMPEQIEQGLTMLKTAEPTLINLLSQNIQGIEKRVKLELPGVVLPVIGFVDLITDDCVIDFKTAKRKWSQVQADESLQPTFYLAALNQMGIVTEFPAKFRYIILTKTKTPQVQILETERTAKDIFRLFDLVSCVFESITKQAFTPTDPSNWWCGKKYCGVWEHCKFGGKE